MNLIQCMPIWELSCVRSIRLAYQTAPKHFTFIIPLNITGLVAPLVRDATPDMDLDLVLLALCLKPCSCYFLQKQILVCCSSCTVHSSENMTSKSSLCLNLFLAPYQLLTFVELKFNIHRCEKLTFIIFRLHINMYITYIVQTHTISY